MHAFTEEFWRNADQLATTISKITPLVGGNGLHDIVSHFEHSPHDRQDEMTQRLGILVARLIQIDRALQACRATSAHM